MDVSSTKTSTNYDYNELAAIPSARDMWAILAESPAVTMARIDVGGSAAGTQSGYRTYDARGDQNRVMIDGLVTTEGTGAIGVYVDYGAFEEVTAGTAGHGADMGQPGVQTQMMIKSGGNQYHGSLYGDYQNSDLQATNITDEQVSRGIRDKEVNRMKVYYDFNADAGGYVRKDKVWWYGSYPRVQHGSQRAALPGARAPDQAAPLQRQDDVLAAGKQQGHRLADAHAEEPADATRCDVAPTARSTAPKDSTVAQRHWAWVYKAEWNKVVSDTSFAEVRGGQFGYNWPLVPNADVDRPADPGLDNSQVSGPNLNRLQNRRRNQVLASVSYFKDGLAGSHDFKFGGEVFHETFFEEFCPTSYGNQTISYKRNSVPRKSSCSIQAPIEATLMTYSFYANDTWRVNNRLTLTPGLRFDRFANSLPEQSHPAGRVQRHADRVRGGRRSRELESARPALRRRPTT